MKHHWVFHDMITIAQPVSQVSVGAYQEKTEPG